MHMGERANMAKSHNEGVMANWTKNSQIKEKSQLLGITWSVGLPRISSSIRLHIPTDIFVLSSIFFTV